MIVFNECFRTAQLIRFKVYSFMTLFPNTKVLGLGVTHMACDTCHVSDTWHDKSHVSSLYKRG